MFSLLAALSDNFATKLSLRTIGEMLAVALTLYLVLVAAGRMLKRRFGAQLGLIYQLWCIALSLHLGLLLIAPTLTIRREFGAAAAILGAGVFVLFLDQYFWRWFFEQKRRTPVPKFVRDVSSVLVVLATMLMVLEFGYQVRVPGLLAGSGIVAIILGLAMQDSLGNIIAGFTLQLSHPFRAGDWLILDRQHVKAVEINWRSSRFVNNDEIQFDMPNQQIVKQTIVNFHGGNGSRHGMRLDIKVEYDAAPNRVKEILAAAAAAADGVIDEPPPNVILKDFADSAIVYEVRFWLDDHRLYNMAADSVRTNIWYALRRQNIKMPYPITTLQINRPRHDDGDALREVRSATLNILRKQPLFQGVQEEHLKTLVEQSAIQSFAHGETMIYEGADGASMFVLIHGEASVIVTTKGKPTRVATLHGGHCFGEMSLLTGEKRSARVVAITDCEVIKITKPVFAEVLQLETDLVHRLSELLAQRHMENEGILQALSQQAGAMAAKKQEVQAGFLNKLKSFFEL